MNIKIINNIATLLLCITIFAFLCLEVILNLTPPISRDALIHHLAVPKLWLIHGGFYEIPWASFSYFPMNIDLLYLIPLYFKNDIAPKFIHFAFGLGIGLLVYNYLKNKLGKNWGLWGFLVFFQHAHCYSSFNIGLCGPWNGLYGQSSTGQRAFTDLSSISGLYSYTDANRAC